MVLAAFTTGCRRGELIGLRWENIRWADRRIELRGRLQGREYVGCKYGSEREVVRYSRLAQLLGRRRQAEGYVFLDPHGMPWTREGPARTFLEEAYVTAGLRRPQQMWHALRHTYASVLAAGGVRREVVEQLMGHARTGTTSIYTHLFKNAFDGVEEALDGVFAGVALTETPAPCGTRRGGLSLARCHSRQVRGGGYRGACNAEDAAQVDQDPAGRRLGARGRQQAPGQDDQGGGNGQSRCLSTSAARTRRGSRRRYAARRGWMIDRTPTMTSMPDTQLLHVNVRFEDDTFWATVEEFPGVFATGDNLIELRESLEEGIALVLAPAGQMPPAVKVGPLQHEPVLAVASAELSYA
jgi:predicted RNase H-like HicB family nuclease